MLTKCLRASEESIALAAELLKGGQLVAFPTETVYGLGANALDEAAVRAIFAAKERPCDNPLIVHIASRSQLSAICETSALADRLMDAFWPGPLTLLLPKKPSIPAVVTANLNSVAVRMPSHPVAKKLLSVCGLPIAAPSANRSGRPSPTLARHVLEDMDGRIPLILDGGACSVGVESTVLDLTGDIPTVLRPGGVTPEEIRLVAGDARVADSVMRPLREGEIAPSPGMRHKHYAPRGQMRLVVGSDAAAAARIIQFYDAQDESACILAFSRNLCRYGARRVFSLGDNEKEAAEKLFALLRDMDGQGVKHIFAEGVRAEGMGLALMNRMARAAGFDIVEADE